MVPDIDYDDYVLISSPLSGPFKQDGITVDIEIYRGEDEPGWLLEVVDQAGASYVWDDTFETDQMAKEEFLRSIKQGGMKQYNPHYRKKMH
ncbi:MAG: hypothetical protein AAGC95_09705 [Pseudomonadota bacterium]